MAFQTYRRSSLWFVFSCCLVLFFTGQHVSAQAESEKRSFDISSGYAINTLKKAAQQVKAEFIFSADLVKGVRTSSIQGEYTPIEAFSLMLAGTSLVVFQHEQTGVYAISKVSELPNQEIDPNPKEPTEMNQKSNMWLKSLATLLTIGIAGTPERLAGQENADEEEVITLSPFTVDASDNTGYTATSTLAGTRIRTNINDLGASISIFTTEFMEDTGATDAATLLSYTSNAEVGGDQGNFSGAQDVDDSRYLQTEARTNPQLNQRIRGLGAADLTRGYFLTSIPFDSYNTDRVTVSRGPNSLLFGIGSPGGVINNSTKKAIPNANFGEVSVKFDTYGTHRASLDYNRTLVKDRAALRLAILDQNLKYKQNPAFEDQTRFYGALDVVLFENEKSSVLGATTLRLNGEQGEVNSSPVEIIPPSVAYHNWFEPISGDIGQFSGSNPPGRVVSPSEGGTWEYQATYNPFENNSEARINTNTHPSHFRGITSIFNDASATTADLGTGDGLQGYQSLLVWRSNRDTVGSAGLAGTPGVGNTPADTPLNRTVQYHTNSPYSESYAIGFAVPTLQNTDIFDYRNQVYSGGIDRVERKFDAMNFAVEQGFFDNRLGIEVAYDQQHYESTQDFFFTGGNGTSTTGPYDIYISIAEFLQNGQPNPNLGRAYTRVARPETRFSESDRETFRVTAFGELDFTERDGFLKHLGNHRFTALYNDYTLDSHSRNSRESWVSNDFDVRGAVQGPLLSSARSTTYTTVYTSDSNLGKSLDEVRLNQINIARPQPGDGYNVFYADHSPTGARTLATGQVQVERYLNNEGISQTNIEAKAVAWQSYLFGDHVVGLLGYREDDTKSFSRASESEVGFDDRLADGRWDPTFTRLSETPSLEESGETVTWSVVGRYPERWFGELPGGVKLQAHYAESENFNPIGLRNNALGESIGQPTGTTTEYGITLSSASKKYSMRVNWFETALNDINASPRINIGSEAYGAINRYRDAFLTGIDFSEQLVTVEGDPAAFPIQDYDTFINTMMANVPAVFRDLTNPRQADTDGDGLWDQIEWDNIPNLRSVANRVSEGFEMELVANPLPGWRIMANIGQQNSVQANTAAAMAQVVESYNSALQSSRAGELNRSPDLTVQTRPINEIWLVNGVAPIRGAKALDNTASNEQREWRYTLVSNYEFMEGSLKGVSIGGAVRWEDEAATGYVFGLDSDTGVPVPDVNQPFFDDGLFSGDLWLSYSKKLLNDKLDWKIQLNIRNLLGERDDIPVKTNPDGQISVVRIPNPRVISITNTFKF